MSALVAARYAKAAAGQQRGSSSTGAAAAARIKPLGIPADPTCRSLDLSTRSAGDLSLDALRHALKHDVHFLSLSLADTLLDGG